MPKRRLPVIFKCERCGGWFTLKLPLCKCPNGPDISKWAAANGY